MAWGMAGKGECMGQLFSCFGLSAVLESWLLVTITGGGKSFLSAVREGSLGVAYVGRTDTHHRDTKAEGWLGRRFLGRHLMANLVCFSHLCLCLPHLVHYIRMMSRGLYRG